MSSAVTIYPEKPVPRAEWNGWCAFVGIHYSPNTIGRNVSYLDQVQITFGEPSYDPLPELPGGKLDFSKAEPPESAVEIHVSSYFMSNLAEVAAVAGAVLKRFGGRWSADPELEHLLPPAQRAPDGPEEEQDAERHHFGSFR
jgi:hypothetical protein